EKISTHFEIVPDSESSKSGKIYSGLINKIAGLDKGKRPFIIAFGGGVIGDLAGFVAAVYRRGIPLVQIPTTLVAQVDSSIGGKVAIDLPMAKNLVGAFYQPRIVICDMSVLKSLPEREIKCGLSEIIKYSIISSRKFFDFLHKNIKPLKELKRKNLSHVIRKCCSIKSKIVSADEKDTKGIRIILNYGHTIGHAIEAAVKYSGAYNHGEAIAAGMLAAAIISNKMGMLSSKELIEIGGLINKAGLPVTIKGLKASKILSRYCHDKKFIDGTNRFVLPIKIGKVKLTENVPAKLIKDAVDEIIEGRNRKWR
ncbi:MAG: 3-dehydroquinate synthase, partial [Candidatus Omnitrophota bacterium]|nr:3-dehydroquinate synthase [Candidatus Omnitrophota bacterium]